MKPLQHLFPLFVLSSLCLQSSSVVADPYKRLGVSQDASPASIKNAYKRLARKWHPDRNKDPEAHAKFIEASSAYELLSDPIRRSHYDRYGTEEEPTVHTYNPYADSFRAHRNQRHFRTFRTHDGSRFFYSEGFPNFDSQSFFRRRSGPPSLPERVWERLKEISGKFVDYFGSSFSSMFITCSAFVVLYMMLRSKDESAAAESQKKPKEPEGNVVHITEMTPQTYFRLLRLKQPGYRTILLLVDNESKKKLLLEFADAVAPYRNHQRLTFAFLNLDKYLRWYADLLSASDIPSREPLAMNLQVEKCRGTVLVLNNYKKNFSIFHNKIPTVSKHSYQGSEFFEQSSDSDANDVENPEPRKQKNHLRREMLEGEGSRRVSLDGLREWLEKGFEGFFIKVNVTSWPNLTAEPK